MEKSSERLEILAKIDEYERNEWWSRDVEADPKTVPLTLDKADYFQKKISTRILTKLANFLGRIFINSLIKNKAMIIKEVRGLEENYLPLENQGAIITCNHFNPFDNFAVYKAIEGHVRKNELYKIIREGNYTNFPGFFGFLFHYANTIPLSSNLSCMKEMMKAVSFYLKRGEKILVYAEQALWWNYRKPRPLTPGAFRFAAENNVPVIPMFITMEDSEITGPDGFPVQEYTVHILPAIFPDEKKSVRENCAEMKEKNYALWKKTYEEFYKIPLEYLKK